ncbi:hypothetical protein [Micromonospora chalcea]|uniref:hypothetical protein n=1 Tax=Micromonospora chalcea TaxID=1874 RepID=UPI00331D2EEF
MSVDGAGAGAVSRPSRYEEVVLGLLRGEGATVLTAGLWLLVTSLFTALFLTFAGWQVWENRMLETRGRIGDAQVVRANYEGPGKSLNDPRHPTHLREADAPIWRWPDFLVTVPPAVAGCLVVPAEWMRFRRRLRERRL